LAFDPSGSVLAVRVVTASGPDRIRLRAAGTGELLRDITPSDFRVDGFALTADEQTIALCGNDKLLHLQELNPAPPEERLPPPAATGEAWAVAFSPKEQTLAVGYDHETDAETLKLWDPVKKTSRLLSGHKGTVMAVAYSPDGRTLATGSYDQHVGLWNTADGKRLDWLVGHTKPVRAVAFSPDGRLLASGGSDHTIMLWNVAERKRMTSWNAHERPIRALAFSPDGRQLASASNDEFAAIWDVNTQNKVFTLADQHNVSCLAYTPDGTLLATGNERFQVKLWDPRGGQLKQTLIGHTGRLRALAFSPDGRTLATGGEDKMVRLWNVATWEELLALPTQHFINGLAFDRGGKTLAAALHDGTTTIWAASAGRPHAGAVAPDRE
jgi:WD40 repeat protein